MAFPESPGRPFFPEHRPQSLEIGDHGRFYLGEPWVTALSWRAPDGRFIPDTARGAFATADRLSMPSLSDRANLRGVADNPLRTEVQRGRPWALVPLGGRFIPNTARGVVTKALSISQGARIFDNLLAILREPRRSKGKGPRRRRTRRARMWPASPDADAVWPLPPAEPAAWPHQQIQVALAHPSQNRSNHAREILMLETWGPREKLMRRPWPELTNAWATERPTGSCIPRALPGSTTPRPPTVVCASRRREGGRGQRAGGSRSRRRSRLLPPTGGTCSAARPDQRTTTQQP